MARILAIDYGGKRTGLAVTDPMQIIATGLNTIDSKELIPYLKKYFVTESVELIIIGLPKNWDELMKAAGYRPLQEFFLTVPPATTAPPAIK